MAVVFERVVEQVQSEMQGQDIDQETRDLLRALDHRARRVLGLFRAQKYIRTSEVARLLGISARQARDLIAGWVADGWLKTADPSKRGRKYRLAEGYLALLD